MFNSSFGVLGCQNPYHCLESLILSGLSGATLFFYYKAYKVITKDRADILEKMDKVIFYLALAFIGLLTFTRVIYVAPFLSFTLRVLYLLLDIVICSVVACNYFPEELHEQIQKGMMGSIGWTILLWFFSVMGRQDQDGTQIECQYFSIILFSLTAMAVSGILFYCGYNSIKNLRETEMKESEEMEESGGRLSVVRRYKQLNDQINHLMVLIVVNAAASFVKLMWDLKKYNANYTLNQCQRVTYPHSFMGFIELTIMEVISTMLPPWGIYYLYYWKNKEEFKADQGNWDRHLSDFDEIRSDLIEVN